MKTKRKKSLRWIDPYYFSKAWRTLREIIRIRDKRTCQYCGRYGMMADHIIPRHKGGPDTLSNLVCSCPRCNKLVGGRVFRSFESKRRWIRKILKLG